jgi:hypothetical protein
MEAVVVALESSRKDRVPPDFVIIGIPTFLHVEGSSYHYIDFGTSDSSGIKSWPKKAVF